MNTNNSSNPTLLVTSHSPVLRPPLYNIETTRPPTILRHDISDHELDLLQITTVDGFLEAFWGCLGALFAALPAAIESAWGAWVSKPPQPLTVVHMIEITIVISAFSAAVTLHLVTHRNRHRTEDIVRGIRGRKKETQAQ